MEGYLRRVGQLKPLRLPVEPTIAQALEYGLSESIFSIDTAWKKCGVNSTQAILQYAHGECEPTGFHRLKVEYFLHSQETMTAPVRRLREMKLLSELSAELTQLLTAFCEDKVSPDSLAVEIGVQRDTVRRWFTNVTQPTPENWLMIHHKFSHLLTKEADAVDGAIPLGRNLEHEEEIPLNGAKPVEEAIEPATAATLEPLQAERISSPSNLSTIADSTAELITAQAGILLTLLLGQLHSLPPSQAVKLLEEIRQQNPTMWFQLNGAIAAFANPEVNYPTWRRTRNS